MTGNRVLPARAVVHRNACTGALPRRGRGFRSAGTAAVASLALAASPGLAQDRAPPADRTLAELLSASVCLSSTVKGGKEAGRPFAIAVPPERSEEFLKRGFAHVECASAGVELVDGQAKQGVCEVARARDPAVNTHYWERFGLTPEESCDLVQAARSAAADAS